MASFPESVYGPMWGKSRRRGRMVGTKAVIAAKYEDCLQKLEHLVASMSDHLSQSEALAFDDLFGDLTSWGSENGAQDQSLDYRLRHSKDLHDSVVEMLKELQDNLEFGSQVLNEYLVSREADGDPQLDGLRELEHKDLEAIAPEVADRTSLEEDATLHEVADIVCDSISHVIKDLKFLTPSLHKPFPQDVAEYASSVSNSNDGDSVPGDREYVELAKQLFPSASKTLQNRLGRANYMRYMAQKLAQERNREADKTAEKQKRHGPQVARKPARQDIAQDAFNFQQPFHAPRPSLPSRPFLPLFSPLPSVREAPSDATSDVASVFDRSMHELKLNRVESATTMATFSSLGFPGAQKSTAQAVQPLSTFPTPQIPKLPFQLDGISEGNPKSFTCNICGYEQEAGSKIKTESDWKQHIMEDLEPYLCTFDKCDVPLDLYALRDEWFKHELEMHRIKRVWTCPACSQEFDSKDAIVQHLPACEDKEDGDSLIMLQGVLRQSLSSRPLQEQKCPLCPIKIAPSDTKNHIAQHLEMFSLLSIQPDEPSDEDDSDELLSMTNDDAMSDTGRKEAVLENFVKEQLKLNTERGKAPPDRDTEGGIAFLDDISEHDGSAWDGESHIHGRSGDAKNDLMTKMLGERDDSAGDGGQAEVKRAARRPFHAPGPPSLASSTEKLPLLRVASFPKDEDFMGREASLANLYKILSEPGRVCVVSGEGGMGKTALAVEFSYRYEQSYHYIFWIQSETPVGLCDTFCQIALQLGLAADGTETETLIKLGREFLENVKDKRWLMIFDNVDKWDDIDQYTPQKTSATNGSILITTRHEALTAPSRPTNYFRIVLRELDIDEGRNLLIHGLPAEICPKERSLRDPDWKIAGEIALLAGLPLLILYISGYVKQSGCTLSEFWDYWDEWRPKVRTVQGMAQSGDSTDRDNVFEIALGDLGGDARKVLEIMAFLDSDGIQKELLVKAEGQNKTVPTYLSATRFRTIIPKLVNQKFVTKTKRKHDDAEVYHVHRVLQARLLRDLNAKPRKRDEAFKTAFSLVRFHLPRASQDLAERSPLSVVKDYLPHVLSLQRAYADPLSITSPTPFPELAELFKDGGYVLWQRYLHNDALKLLNSAEKILDELESDNEDLRTEISVTINLVLQYYGIVRRKEAQDRVNRILDFRVKQMMRKKPEDVTDVDREQLNNARADFANALLQFNAYERAEPIYEGCYKSCVERAGTPQFDDDGVPVDPQLAFSLAKLTHHLAYCKMYRRDWAEAIRLANLAVAMIERVGDKQMTMRYQFDLACIVLQSGDMEKSLAIHREILQARLGLQGRASSSYHCLQSQYAFAVLCQYMGRLDEAEHWMRNALSKALNWGGKSFWPEAAIARTKYQLSQVLREKNGGEMTAEAEQLAVEAKDVLSRMLPYDPEPIVGVKEEDTLALFDHLQPVFGGRFTSLELLKYVGAPMEGDGKDGGKATVRKEKDGTGSTDRRTALGGPAAGGLERWNWGGGEGEGS